jgi:predicted MPP superfamily phosphohydrolase
MSMSLFFRIVFLLVLLVATTGIVRWFLRRAYPEAWERFGKRLAFAAVAVAVIGVLGWQGPRSLGHESTSAFVFLFLTSAVITSFFALAVTSPVWGPAGLVTKKIPVDDNRRRFLRGLSGSMPLAAASTGPVGAVAATLVPELTRLEVRSPRVPKELDGFQILQLTDVHLGVFIHASQFQAVVDVVRAAGVVPDAIALTGDIADDFTQLPEALTILKGLVPAERIFACIGNHEIYRGRATCERIYAEAGVRLLSNDGVVVDGDKGGGLYICGANDPARGLDGPADFLADTVARAVAGCPSTTTAKLLLSHRPRGFVPAQAENVTLTLAGHTHGGQVAAFGRSLFELVWPESFMLGRYDAVAKDGHTSTLYTSAGLGHWMPFRLNCPCEAVLVTLRAA